MTRSTVINWTLAAALAPLWVIGCDSKEDSSPAEESAPAAAPSEAAADGAGPAKAEPPAPPPPLVTVADADQALAKTLSGKVDGERFKRDDVEKANAKAFLWLAATSEDTKVVAASLRAMNRTWTSSKSDDDRLTVDEDYHRVVEKHLGSKDPAILEAAFEAARPSVRGDEPGPKAIAQLEAIVSGHEEVGARYLAVDTAGSIKHDNAALGKILLAALADGQHPVVQSKGLDRIPFVAKSMPDRDKVFARVEQLLDNEEPGIRGNAARAAGNLAKDDEVTRIRPKLETMLSDDNAFVRAAALGALGRLRDPGALPKIVGLLGDSTMGTHEIKGWKTIAGKDGRMHHQGGAWLRVDRMALQAMQDCTWKMGKAAFKHDKIDFKTQDKDIAKAVKQAKSWYKKNKSKVATG